MSEDVGNSSVWIAATEGDVDGLKREIDAGADVEAVSRKKLKFGVALGSKPLIAAVIGGNTQCLDLLIAAGANQNCLHALEDDETLGEDDPSGQGGLWAAAQNDRADMIKKLLSLGLDKNFGCSMSGTPLIAAAFSGSEAAAAVLIEAGTDLNKPDGSGLTPLHNAAKGLRVVRGKGPSLEDTESGRFKITKLLLEAGADASMKDNAGNTPLGVCTSEHIKKLLSGDMNVTFPEPLPPAPPSPSSSPVQNAARAPATAGDCVCLIS